MHLHLPLPVHWHFTAAVPWLRRRAGWAPAASRLGAGGAPWAALYLPPGNPQLKLSGWTTIAAIPNGMLMRPGRGQGAAA